MHISKSAYKKLSIILTVVMIMSMLVPAAFAATGVTAVNLVGPSSAVTAGSNVTLTANATGASSTTQYYFWLRNAQGAWVGHYGDNNGSTLTLSAVQAGTYVAQAYADGVASNKVYFMVGSSATLSATYANGQITATATATNVTNPMYDFWVQDPSGTWSSVNGHFIFSNTCTIPAAAAGTYNVVANVTDMDFYQVLGTSAWNSNTFVQGTASASTALTVQSVSAIDSTTALVTLKSGASSVQASQFTIADANNNSLAVTAAQLSTTDNTKVTLTTATQTPGTTYTLTVGTTTATFVGDNAAPTFTVSAVDSTHLKVVYSEKVQKTGAETIANYSINYPATNTLTALAGGGGDVAALEADGKTLDVTLGSLTLTNGTYYFVVDTGNAVKDLGGNAIAQNSSVAFSGEAVADTTPPQVVSANYDGANGIVTVVFSEPIQASTIDKTKFTVTDGTTNVALTSFDSSTLASKTLTITLGTTSKAAIANLGANKTLSLTASAVSDIAGNAIKAASGISLAASAYPTAATYDQATNVLNITFNKAVKVSTLALGEFTLDGSASRTLGAAGDVVNTTTDGTTVQVTLKQDAGLTTYEGSAVTNRHLDFTAAGGTFVDTNGTAVVATSNIALTYTADTTAPTMLNASWNNTTGRLTLTFSEPIDLTALGAGASFTDLTGNLDPADAETVVGYNSVVTYQKAKDGVRTTSITTNAAETPSTSSKIYFTLGTFKDAAGNKIAATDTTTAIPVTYVDATPPTVTGAAQKSTNLIDVTFSKKVDQTTAETLANYAIVKSDNPAVTLTPTSAKLQANGTDVIITTQDNVVNGYTYKITVTNVKDASGNVIVNSGLTDGTGNAKTFTANATTDTTSPTLKALGVKYTDVNGNYKVDAGDTITLTFTEPIAFSNVTESDFTTAGATGAGTYFFGNGATFTKGTTADSILVTLGTTPKLQTADLGTATIDSKASSNIKDLAGNNAIALGAPVTVAKPDTTAPVLKSAKYVDQNADGKVNAGDYLILTYSKALDTTVSLAGIANTDFQYNNASDTTGVISAADYITSTQVRLTIGAADLDGAASSNTYLSANSKIDIAAVPVHDVKDLWGNAAVASALVSITSDDTTRPTIVSAKYTDVDASGTISNTDTIVLTMSETVQGTPVVGDFYLSNGATLGTPTFVVAGNMITITMAGGGPAFSAGVTTINIKAGGTANIVDAAGNTANQTANGAVIN